MRRKSIFSSSKLRRISVAELARVRAFVGRINRSLATSATDLELLILGLALLLAAGWAAPTAAVDTTWTFNGNGNWNVPANWSAGVPSNSTFNAFIDDGDSAVTVTLNVNNAVGNLSIGSDDTLSFADTFDLNITGSSVINDGVISLNAAGVPNFNTDINFTAPVATLSGNGRLSLGGAFQNRIINTAVANELINSSTHTIAGGGQLGVNNMKLTNQGMIDANIAGMTMVVDPNSSGAVNTGTMRATNGGILRLQGGTITNAGGLIRALDGSTVELVGGGGTNGTTISGGTLASEGTGTVQTVSGDSGVVLENVTLAAGSRFQFGTNLDATLRGTFTNHGTVEQSSSGTATTQILIDGDVLLTGTGTWMMNNHPNNYFRGTANGFDFTNDSQHTIQGSGDIGNFSNNLVNNGTIIANQATPLQLSSPNLGTVTNNGTLRAANGATLNVNLGVLGTIDNQGTVEALNGSNVTYLPSATATNNMAGVLTGGTWRAVAIGGGATITLRGNNITRIAIDTEVVLSGAGSVVQVAATPIDATLTTNDGTLRILDNRDYTAVPAAALVNNGDLELGGGTFTSASLTNNVGGEIFGFGTITPRPTNAGTIRAVGGTLSIPLGIQGGSGTVQVDPGATLDVSSAVLSTSADSLIHNGAGLNLGGNDFSVGADYQNANFGVGNTFNARANVTGTGQVVAAPGISQTLGGDVTGGVTATATMNFGNVHVGDAPTRNYQINNSGASGPSLRGAIQTAAGGANLTDSRLTGAGVTASNFGPIATGANSGNLDVTFNASSAGALTGQEVRIVNNFDNAAEQSLEITGAAYRYANPAPHAPVDFGIVHVGDVLQRALSITNTVANDGFSERLNASLDPSGDVTGDGSITALAPGATDNTSLVVSINTATAGSKSGTAVLSFVSNGTGTSGLPDTVLPGQTVNVQAQVNNFAVADVVKLAGSGVFNMTGANEFTLDLGSIVQGQVAPTTELGVMNDAAAPSDSLAGNFTLAAPGFMLAGFDSFTGVAAGATHDGLSIALDPSTVGTFSGQITLQPQSTNPRPFNMNLAPITINLVGEVLLAGDYSDNGVVDAADYVIWRKSIGGSNPAADGNRDGIIDSADYDVWRTHFGRTAGSSSFATIPTAPEPTAAICLLTAIHGLALCRARRSR
jgi:hypothetical protein